MYACFCGRLKVVRMFVEYYKVDVNKVDNKGQNGFIKACIQRNLKVILYLLHLGIDVQCKDHLGKIGYDYFNKIEDENLIWQIRKFIEKNKLKIKKPIYI